MKHKQEWRRRESILLAELGVRRQIGHLPLQTDVVEGWTFRRCPCGFDLAMSAARVEWVRGGPLLEGQVVYWLRKNHAPQIVESFTVLLRALNHNCRVHKRYYDRREPWGHAASGQHDCDDIGCALIAGDYVVVPPPEEPVCAAAVAS